MLLLVVQNAETMGVREGKTSVLNQTYPNFELLVVDDCSKDNSLQLIQQKAQSDDRIRVIALEHNAGVANARNVGIKEARGEFIALLDNDDLWTVDKLERQLALANKGADIVYCSYDFIDEKNNPIKRQSSNITIGKIRSRGRL